MQILMLRLKYDVHVEAGQRHPAWLRMPPRHHRKNQTQPMPHVS